MLKIQTGLSRKSETITASRFQFNLKTNLCWQYPAEMSAQKLKYLSSLLKNLPDTLPDCGDDSELEYDGLHPFNLDSHGSELESKSEIGEEVRSGMENDDFGPAEPPEDNEFNVDDEVDINSPILRKIIGQDSDFMLTAATASKTTGTQPFPTNTSFEMNDEDFDKLWES